MYWKTNWLKTLDYLLFAAIGYKSKTNKKINQYKCNKNHSERKCLYLVKIKYLILIFSIKTLLTWTLKCQKLRNNILPVVLKIVVTERLKLCFSLLVPIGKYLYFTIFL